MNQALLVGINRYALNGGANNLNGCVEDVLDVCNLLLSRGWSINNICPLLNEDATCAAILRKLQDLELYTQPGDSLLYWHSGHGTLIDGADESSDVADESLCPTDFSFDDPDTQLTDAKFRAAIAGIPDGALFCGFDACHTGQYSDRLIRRNYPLRHRYIQNPKLTARPRVNRFARDIMPSSQAHVSLSGCRENETSGEAPDATGQVRGAMTLAFTTAMRTGNPISRRDCVTQMQTIIGDSQHPVLTGRQDLLERPVLDSARSAPRVLPLLLAALVPFIPLFIEGIKDGPAIIAAIGTLFKAAGANVPPHVNDAATWTAWLHSVQANPKALIK